MSFPADLRTFLLADSTVEGLVDTRIYPVQLPQKPVLPAIRYSVISGFRTHSTPGTHGLARQRMQLDCYANTYSEAYTLAEAVRQCVDAYRGAAGSSTVQGAFLANEDEFFEAEMKAYLISRDYFIWFEET